VTCGPNAPRRELYFAGAAGAEGATCGPDASRRRVTTLPDVKAFRRGLLVVGIAVLAGLVVRLRGKGGVPPTTGGWRELEGPDFR
jgi:hypothetical protein